MRAHEILPKKKDEPVTETNGAFSTIPGRNFTPDRSKRAKAKRNVENILNGGIPDK